METNNKPDFKLSPHHYESGMSEYFRMHDWRNMYGLWEHFCKAFYHANSINWCSKEEISHVLKIKNYSKEIAKELSELWSDSCNGCYKKGYDKAIKERDSRIAELERYIHQANGKIIDQFSENQALKSECDKAKGQLSECLACYVPQRSPLRKEILAFLKDKR